MFKYNIQKIAFTILCLSLSYTLMAQIEEGHFSKNISADYGLFTSMNGLPMDETILGSSYNLQYAQFITYHKGFRTGISFTNNLCGNSKIVTFPLYFALRTIKRDQSLDYIKTDNFGTFIISTIIAIIPKNYELNIGPNIGYASSGSTVATTGYLLHTYTQGWTQNAGMFLSMDVVGKMKFCFGNFGIAISPSITYLLTKNMRYQSTNTYNYSNGYKPGWFFRGTIGLSYNF